MKFIVHTDGGARGNPGPAAIGVVIEEVHSSPFMVHGKAEVVIEFGKTIGEATNNFAEYTAVIEALKWLKNYPGASAPYASIQCFLDSTLVVNQLNGTFKVKNARLRELLTEIRVAESELGGEIAYHFVPREENTRADFLVNKALDENS
ncbi:ribonuclease HI family protein [Patescibacteria group bacterium]|nr:ribonuclease HI family protein [Patescibacteria group bacterium]MBU1472851.1 ribonuclease HI family protein [Patescibacteria group bacterium]MBU2459508.1 ribonuclease HI family protein [Patescibacteria group bacterium]MBU2543957.1 ribonuclease HI family protein [Patescibacteria group bacterium]